MSGQSYLLGSDKKGKGKQKMSERALKAATPSLSSTKAQQGQSSDTLVPSSQALFPASYGNSNIKSYPPAIATYEKVVEDVFLFKESHDLFFKMLGKYVEVPKIGEDDLDLYRLFVEVTSRGGIEKVIMDQRWEEVVIAYDLPPTSSIASPSLFLRSHYMSLLYHYEQLYYFRKNAPGSSTPAIPSMGIIDESTQRAAPFADPSLEELIGSTVSGTIEGKCDNGYFVSVDLGSHKLDGILFPVQEETTEPQISETIVASPRQGRKRSRTDSGLPKVNKSSYNFFYVEEYARLKHLHQGGVRNLTKMIAESWNNLPESERQPYKDMAAADKERYRAELKEYKALHASNAR